MLFRVENVVKTDTIIFASDDSEQSVNEARAYIKEQRLDGDDVKLIKREGQVLVVSKRELWNG